MGIGSSPPIDPSEPSFHRPEQRICTTALPTTDGLGQHEVGRQTVRWSRRHRAPNHARSGCLAALLKFAESIDVPMLHRLIVSFGSGQSKDEVRFSSLEAPFSKHRGTAVDLCNASVEAANLDCISSTAPCGCVLALARQTQGLAGSTAQTPRHRPPEHQTAQRAHGSAAARETVNRASRGAFWPDANPDPPP